MNINDYIRQPEGLMARRTRIENLRDMMDTRKIRKMQMEEMERTQGAADKRRQALAAGVVPGQAATVNNAPLNLGNFTQGPVNIPGIGQVDAPRPEASIGGGQAKVGTPARFDGLAALTKMGELDPAQVPQMQGEFAKQEFEANKQSGEMQKMALEIRRGMVGLDLDTLKLVGARGARVAQVLGPVLEAPKELQPRLYAAVVEMLEKSGEAEPGSITRQFPGAEALHFMVSQGRTLSQQSKVLADERDAKERNRHNVESEKNTRRGQDMADKRLQKSGDLARERFEETKRANGVREQAARDAREMAAEYRARGQELKAIQMEMKAEGYLKAVEGDVGFVDNALGAVGYETEDAAEANRARGALSRIRGARIGGAAPLPRPKGASGGAVETQTHPVTGEVFERRKGSNDPWKKKVRQ